MLTLEPPGLCCDDVRVWHHARMSSELPDDCIYVVIEIPRGSRNKYEIDLPAIEVDGDLPNGAKGDILKVELNFTVAKQTPVLTRSPVAAPAP